MTEEYKMIGLGIYRRKGGKKYHCLYFPDVQTADATGPLPEPGQSGARGVAFTVKAKSEQEARQKLAEKIGPGKWL